MSIPTLALFTRSLRLESRQIKSYGARMALLGVTFIALLITHSMGSFFGAPGLRLFSSIVYIDFFFISIAATSYFASAIAEEKEEMTLGLLRMTSLSPVSILLGKSTTRSLSVIMILAAQFPFTILAVTLGGVGISQVVAAYCTLGAYIVFVSNLALLCSVMCKRAKNAGGLTLFLLLVFFILPLAGPLLLQLMGFGVPMPFGPVPFMGGRGLWGSIFKWMFDASAFTRLLEIMTTGFSGSAVGFQVISNLTLGAILFLLSWLVFDFFTREEKQAAPARGLAFRRTSALRRLGARRAWSRPLIWKDFHFLSGGVPGIIIRYIVYGAVLAIVGYIFYRAGFPVRQLAFDYDGFGLAVMVIADIGLFLEMCYFASRIFKEEIKWKTLPAITMLPIPTYKLAYHKALGCLIALIPAATYFVLGAFISPIRFGDIIVGTAYGLPGVIFFLYLVVFFSLIVKRGALGLAFLVAYIASMVFSVFVQFAFRGAFSIGLVLAYTILAGLIIGLHFAIGALLRKAAAQ
jgi:hypothetical protein